MRLAVEEYIELAGGVQREPEGEHEAAAPGHAGHAVGVLRPGGEYRHAAATGLHHLLRGTGVVIAGCEGKQSTLEVLAVRAEIEQARVLVVRRVKHVGMHVPVLVVNGY